MNISSQNPDHRYRFSFPAATATPIDLVAASVRLRQLSHPQLTEMLEHIKTNSATPVSPANSQALAKYEPPTIYVDTSPLEELEIQFDNVLNMFLMVIRQTLDDMEQSGRLRSLENFEIRRSNYNTKAEVIAFEYWKAQLKHYYMALFCANYDEAEVITVDFIEL